MNAETVDLRNEELMSEVVYIDKSEGFVLLINNQKIKLNERQAYQIHNKFTTAVTQELLNRIERGENIV